MNERTRRLALLAEQAIRETDLTEVNGGIHITPAFEKFAELIVRECISINRQRLFSDYEGDSHRVAHNNALLCATSDMFEHFGVGE